MASKQYRSIDSVLPGHAVRPVSGTASNNGDCYYHRRGARSCIKQYKNPNVTLVHDTLVYDTLVYDTLVYDTLVYDTTLPKKTQTQITMVASSTG